MLSPAPYRLLCAEVGRRLRSIESLHHYLLFWKNNNVSAKVSSFITEVFDEWHISV